MRKAVFYPKEDFRKKLIKPPVVIFFIISLLFIISRKAMSQNGDDLSFHSDPKSGGVFQDFRLTRYYDTARPIAVNYILTLYLSEFKNDGSPSFSSMNNMVNCLINSGILNGLFFGGEYSAEKDIDNEISQSGGDLFIGYSRRLWKKIDFEARYLYSDEFAEKGGGVHMVGVSCQRNVKGEVHPGIDIVHNFGTNKDYLDFTNINGNVSYTIKFFPESNPDWQLKLRLSCDYRIFHELEGRNRLYRIQFNQTWPIPVVYFNEKITYLPRAVSLAIYFSNIWTYNFNMCKYKHSFGVGLNLTVNLY